MLAGAIVAVAPASPGLLPREAADFTYEPIATVHPVRTRPAPLRFFPLRPGGGHGQWVIDRGDGLPPSSSGHGAGEELADAELVEPPARRTLAKSAFLSGTG